MLLSGIYVADNNETYWGLHAKCSIFLSDVNLMWSLSRGLNEFHYIKYNGNSSSGSPAYVCGREYGQTGATNTVGAFRDYTKAPKS